ncbi:hypothetical protein GCM10010174_48460 [Kutzneria viridogrisea]|uniref:DUF222 domain-containing protein n=1 Tax=Kutzneria viridogrisea TaxID=47990 RepID=A0ABR6BYQ3_9PSEU|nr:hypothetical protein [Kutzneria albida]MBA8932039.1 hypothetical protein [Kutzneria viridogrisea]
MKIGEAVALSDVLDLRWMDLTAQPHVSRHHAELAAVNRRVNHAYTMIKEAAAAYLGAQIDLSLTVRTARDAGLPLAEVHTSWLDIPAERAVIEARVESAQKEAVPCSKPRSTRSWRPRASRATNPRAQKTGQLREESPRPAVSITMLRRSRSNRLLLTLTSVRSSREEGSSPRSTRELLGRW